MQQINFNRRYPVKLGIPVTVAVMLCASGLWLSRAIRAANNERSLIASIRCGNDGEAVRLLTSGANPNATDVSARRASFLDSVVQLLKPQTDRHLDTALTLAVRARSTVVVSELLKRRANANAVGNGTTALNEACRLLSDSDIHPDSQSSVNARIRKLHQIIDMLVLSGARTTAQDSQGASSVWYASYAGDTVAARFLIQHRADVNIVENNGDTALAAAFIPHAGESAGILFLATPSLDLVRTIIRGGARVNGRDYAGTAPIILAAELGDKSIVQLLLKSGAIPDVRDRYGKSAADMASLMGFRDIVHLLNDAVVRRRSGKLGASAKQTTIRTVDR